MKVTAFEVASRYVYPSLRRRLVEHLREKGLRQREIAGLLHVTQSAVSRYLNMDRGALIDISKFRDIDRDLKRLADEIIEFRPSEYEIHTELIRIALKMLGKGYVCSFHASIDPGVNPAECRVCIELFS
ncbi:transcriptional regulator [Thermococcus sp.]